MSSRSVQEDYITKGLASFRRTSGRQRPRYFVGRSSGIGSGGRTDGRGRCDESDCSMPGVIGRTRFLSNASPCLENVAQMTSWCWQKCMLSDNGLANDRGVTRDTVILQPSA